MDTALTLRPEPAHDPARTLVTDEVRAFARAAQAENTRRAYATAQRQFGDWCAARGVAALPAAPEAVAAWISERARTVTPATLALALAAIRDQHRKRGLDSPTEHEAVRAVFSGIARTYGVAPRKAAPMTAETLAVVLSRLGSSRRDRRDRALLLLGMGAALRRSELVALDIEDLSFAPQGLDVRVRRSKTDQAGRGAVVSIPHGRQLRPVAAVRDWLDAAAITTGPVFRPVGRGDRLQDGRLTARAVALIVKERIAAAGLDPAQYSGHSLRAGFVTSAVERGAALTRVQQTTRHTSMDVLAGYARHAERYKEHAGESFL